MPQLPEPAPAIAAPISPGTYVRLRREALGITLDDLSLCLETAPPISARTRAEWLAQMEADTAPISMLSGLAIADIVRFDLVVLSRLIAVDDGARDVLVPALCRRCACSEMDACDGGCSWAEPDLCSVCASAVESLAA